MARYVSLLKFTPQGVRSLKESSARAAAFGKAAEKAGVKVEAQLWTTGEYDGILILSADDETKVLATIAKLAALGTSRPRPCRPSIQHSLRPSWVHDGSRRV